MDDYTRVRFPSHGKDRPYISTHRCEPFLFSILQYTGIPEPTDRECRKAHTLCARIDNFKNVRMIFKTTIKKTKTTSQMLFGLCLQKIKPMVNTISWVYSNSLKLTLSNRLLLSEGLWTTKSQ